MAGNRAESTDVFIHAGAHRTGTSRFQTMLAVNADRLQREGYALAYPARDGVESGKLRLKLPSPRDAAGSESSKFLPGVRRQLMRLGRGSTRGLVLSEENIPGRMFPFYYGEFFPAARVRMEVLKGALPGVLRHLIYVVRPYEALYTSGFRKRAQDNKVDDFAGLRANMMAINTGWPELIEAFQTQLKPEKITVIEYGARGSSVGLLERLLGRDVAGLEEPEQLLNQRATDAALFALQTVYRAGEGIEREACKAVIEAHANDTEQRGFAEFSAPEGAVLAQKYADDLGRIAAMPQVAFVK